MAAGRYVLRLDTVEPFVVIITVNVIRIQVESVDVYLLVVPDEPRSGSAWQ